MGQYTAILPCILKDGIGEAYDCSSVVRQHVKACDCDVSEGGESLTFIVPQRPATEPL